jgi:hypothetical protein
LLTVVGIIGILASLLLAGLSSAKAKSRQTACLNNLHQIGLGFTGFALDHEGKYPMDIPERLGGSLEYNSTNLIGNTPFSRDFHHFQALSNEVPNLKIMVCPADRTRRAAQNYATFSNTNLSYWVNTKAQPHATLSSLAGDWNVYNAFTNSNDIDHLAFTPDLHRRKGSVLFADGRVEITRSLDVERQLPPDTVAVTKPPASTTPTAVGGSTARPQPTGVTPPPTALPSQSPTTSSVSNPANNRTPNFALPAATNATAKSASAGPDRPSSGYAMKRRSDPPEVGQISPTSPDTDAPGVIPPSTLDDSEPWDTPGFRLFKVFAFLAYLISLLWALIALLILYLRSRLAQREREQAPPSITQE